MQGVGSYLFASYAAEREAELVVLLRRADRGAVVLLSSSVLIALLAAAAVPTFGELLTRGGYDLAPLAVLGWGMYTASCAVVLPYGSLAAVRGRQAQVFGLRLVDAGVGLTATVVALGQLDVAPSVVPWLLSAGSLAGAVLIRQRLLVPATVRAATPLRQAALR